MKKQLFLLTLFMFFFYAASAQKGKDKDRDKDIPLGIWMNEEKEARFEIFKCGDKLCGKIVWLKEPNRDGKPKLDKFNPDKNLQTRPILGLVFMKNFKYEGNGKWDDGTIYDPQTGKTYSCYIKVLNPNQMEVKGYIGVSLIGRSQLWTRVE